MQRAGQIKSREQQLLQPVPLHMAELKELRGGEPGRGCFRKDSGASALSRIRLSENNPLYFISSPIAFPISLLSLDPSLPRFALEAREKCSLALSSAVRSGRGEDDNSREKRCRATLASALHSNGRGAFRGGFSLIEILVVIAIIGLLAATILPSLAAARRKAEVARARQEMKAIETGLTEYYGAYSRYPMPARVVTGDFTFGNNELGSVVGEYRANNSELMAVLLAEDRLCNAGHALNPQKKRFLDPTRAASANLPGLGPDLVYRDPWGNPYIITIDFNYDGRCRDAFYRLAVVSADPSNPASGLVGLTPRRENAGDRDCYELGGPVMIWSFGPDAKVDPNQNAMQSGGVNRDNVLNWLK